MTNLLSDNDKSKMKKVLQEDFGDAVARIKHEYEAMLRGKTLEPKLSPWSPNTKIQSRAAECCGFGRGGTHRCCNRAGEYNGFASGLSFFDCPENCACHD